MYEDGYKTYSLNKVTVGLVLSGVLNDVLNSLGCEREDITEYIDFQMDGNGLVMYRVNDIDIIDNILLYENSLKNEDELMIDIVVFNQVFRLIKKLSMEMKYGR